MSVKLVDKWLLEETGRKLNLDVTLPLRHEVMGYICGHTPRTMSIHPEVPHTR